LSDTQWIGIGRSGEPPRTPFEQERCRLLRPMPATALAERVDLAGVIDHQAVLYDYVDAIIADRSTPLIWVHH
jgi:hypothetical protein